MATVLIDRKAKKFLMKLNHKDRSRITRGLRELSEGVKNGVIPPYLDIKRLKGKLKGYYRLRIGDFRIIFSIDIDRLSVMVLRISRRKAAYR